jgi:hypothetical protein
MNRAGTDGISFKIMLYNAENEAAEQVATGVIKMASALLSWH